jgi:hypothetical protein
MQQAEYFVDTLSAYKSDFALFPDFFYTLLMTEYNQLTEAAAMRKLSEHTGAIINEFTKLARAYKKEKRLLNHFISILL